ncbi:MAG: DUF3995 domain-containing protein, partial [Chloroflexota bacterium]
RDALAWAGYAACMWAFVFAAVSFYWAAGGAAGVDTLGSTITRLPGIVALLWVTGALKVLGGLLALSLARPWGRMPPRRLLLTLSWAGGVGMGVYGGIPLIINGLMVAGVLHVAGDVDWTAMRWHVFLWDPWWLIGGLLFSLAAWSYQHRSRPATSG